MLDQVGIERQHHERQVGVNDADVDRQVGVEDLQGLVYYPNPQQEAVEQAVVAEDAHPGVDPDQDRGPGRHHDEQQQNGLGLLVGPCDGVGHGITDQQAQKRADEGHLEGTQIGRDIELILLQQQVVAHVEQDGELTVCPGHHIGVGRDRHIRFGEADLHHYDEGQQEEQEEPEEGDADHQLASPHLLESSQCLHDCSTTPLSSSQ